ncbi:unnamed protein product [Ilex paraguariensis]|uniref:Uncharacterized protein n=1 Tax=Ilex paraguariensis TaxID=185542 RepID=A0ABC8SFI3_9AQUA
MLVMEELENLEETLNESIRESMGARAGRMSHGKKKGATEDDEEYLRYIIRKFAIKIWGKTVTIAMHVKVVTRFTIL